MAFKEIFVPEKKPVRPLVMTGKLGKGKKKDFSVEFIPGKTTAVPSDQFDYLINEPGSVLAMLLEDGSLIMKEDWKKAIVEEKKEKVKEAEKELKEAKK